MEETNWLLNLADNNNFIKGVVGWVDLRSPTIYQQLEAYRNNNKLVGVRHVVHDEPDDYFMLQPSFLNGIAALKEFDLTYDLLLFPKHIPVAVQLIKKFPDQLFVIDHIAKPFISKQEISPWKEDLKALGYYPNVYCKLSGMVTETNWNNWKEDDFKPYLDIVTESFGADRIMIGSDWPVCTLSGNYAATMKIVTDYANQFPVDISNAILGGNCIEFYKILNAD
jgi:L-fuconolactonase